MTRPGGSEALDVTQRVRRVPVTRRIATADPDVLAVARGEGLETLELPGEGT